MELGLKDRLAIVTGGSRGIGFAVASMLAREGGDVAILSRHADEASDLCACLSDETGRTVRPYACDTGDDGRVSAVVDAIAGDFGRIDILVNGASLPGGGGGFRPLAQIDTDDVLTDLNVKVMGYLRMARQVAPHMVARKWGRIVNIGGMAVHHTGSTEGSIRCAAVGAFTKNLADELGPDGVTVNAIHPGPTLTERSRDVVAKMAAAQGKTEAEIERQFAATSVLGRFVTPDEVATVVAFLVSAGSAVVNGESLELAGGTRGVIRY
ncbi:SDR family NAD(P)-dependent oxidoreductase [Sphingobium sp. YBL2]|uniref:SDR family NAD(P)-dependent oxidoreductase n=1 Tax=Sphingobium sp. (strain YBL2) TaxID=484429 RepID=UPI0005CBED2D|nr:SDR family oxidoreductase [Sphingobium sp. YBL2]AJR24189.1 hypothetical protein TZ53_11085 [Sphingobium sp. YBL2]